jgi:molybdenum cofactor cytidylyltransferase
MVAGVILTAGLSSRLGFPKALLPVGDQTLIRLVLLQAPDSDLEQVILVLGHKRSQIMKSISDLKTHPRLRVTYNPDYRQGLSTSVRAGLSSINPACAGALFLLGDQPLVTSRLIGRLIRAFRKTPETIIVPRYGARPGNPVLFPATFFPRLLRLSGDRGGRDLIRRFPERVRFIPIRPRRLGRDVDTWEDYESLKKFFGLPKPEKNPPSVPTLANGGKGL